MREEWSGEDRGIAGDCDDRIGRGVFWHDPLQQYTMIYCNIYTGIYMCVYIDVIHGSVV